jgi:hypothetical protein
MLRRGCEVFHTERSFPVRRFVYGGIAYTGRNGDSNMATTGYDNFVELSEHDKQRMACLYEEVQGRLKEMSLIVARTLRMEISERTTLMLRPIGVKANTASSSFGRATLRQGQVEVHCTETSEGHYECGCYDYDAGTCGPC